MQAQILELIDRVKKDFDIGVILITHDLAVISDVAQKVMVMYAARAMEIGTKDEVFDSPLHPYTWGLLESIPRVDQRGGQLIPIEGSPPSLINLPQGCVFRPRCPYKAPRSEVEQPELRDRGGGHPEAYFLPVEEKERIWREREAERMVEA